MSSFSHQWKKGIFATGISRGKYSLTGSKYPFAMRFYHQGKLWEICMRQIPFATCFLDKSPKAMAKSNSTYFCICHGVAILSLWLVNHEKFGYKRIFFVHFPRWKWKMVLPLEINNYKLSLVIIKFFLANLWQIRAKIFDKLVMSICLCHN